MQYLMPAIIVPVAALALYMLGLKLAFKLGVFRPGSVAQTQASRATSMYWGRGATVYHACGLGPVMLGAFSAMALHFCIIGAACHTPSAALESVRPGSLAALAGFKAGDKLTAVNGHASTDYSRIEHILSRNPAENPAHELRLSVTRANGESETVLIGDRLLSTRLRDGAHSLSSMGFFLPVRHSRLDFTDAAKLSAHTLALMPKALLENWGISALGPQDSLSLFPTRYLSHYAAILAAATGLLALLLLVMVAIAETAWRLSAVFAAAAHAPQHLKTEHTNPAANIPAAQTKLGEC